MSLSEFTTHRPLFTDSPGAEVGPVCKICPLILTLDPYWGPQGGLE